MEKMVFSLFLAKRSPSVPIRLMAGCLMLKHLYNPGDHHLPEFRVRSVNFQYFCGGVFLEHMFPFDPSDFVLFINFLKLSIITKINHWVTF